VVDGLRGPADVRLPAVREALAMDSVTCIGSHRAQTPQFTRYGLGGSRLRRWLALSPHEFNRRVAWRVSPLARSDTT